MDREGIRRIAQHRFADQQSNEESWYSGAISYHEGANVLWQHKDSIHGGMRVFLTNAALSIELLLLITQSRKPAVSALSPPFSMTPNQIVSEEYYLKESLFLAYNGKIRGGGQSASSLSSFFLSLFAPPSHPPSNFSLLHSNLLNSDRPAAATTTAAANNPTSILPAGQHHQSTYGSSAS